MEKTKRGFNKRAMPWTKSAVREREGGRRARFKERETGA